MGNASRAHLGEYHAERSAADNMRNAGPGWYFDPDDRAIYRNWNGHRWTDHRSDTVLSVIPT